MDRIEHPLARTGGAGDGNNAGDALAAFVKREAHSLGFNSVGVTSARGETLTADRLHAFVADGHHGTMQWMADRMDWRADPQAMWPEAQSAIVVGLSYAPARNPLDALGNKSLGVVSAYAKRRDYHDVLKKRLKQLARTFADAAGADVKVFVDTAPLMEKPLAARAGLGWQGKHTNLVSRTEGSWLFLGVILTTAALTADAVHEDLCGRCRRCLDICPTQAFTAPYRMDARRCIAYLTIEHDGPIPHEFRRAIGNRVFGCDDCLAVCPWNKFAESSADHKLAIKDSIDDPPLETLLTLDDKAFRALFANTPVKRTGRDKVVRNALIAAGNSGERYLLEHVRRLLSDESAMVRGAAVWALSQLTTDDEFENGRIAHHASENDADVRREWTQEQAD